MQTGLRILHIIHGLTIGGAERDLLDKSSYLARGGGYDISICCLMRRGELATQAEAAGIRVLGPLMSHRYDPVAGLRIRRLVLGDRWCVVHTHLAAANLMVAAVMATIAQARRPPLLAGEHALAERWSRRTMALYRVLQRYMRRVLVPSQAAYAGYEDRGIDRHRLLVLPNAVDKRRFAAVDRNAVRARIRTQLRVPADAYLIGTVCRLEGVKGLPVLLKAVEGLEVYVVIAGEGPERAELESIIRMRRLGKVQLLGSRADIPELLCALDLFVLPSHSESFGIAIVEALLAETPVLATNVGAIPEVTGGGKYARLVPAGDPTALAEAIRWMASRPEQVSEQAQKGRTFVARQFSLETVSRMQHELYMQLSEASCGSPRKVGHA